MSFCIVAHARASLPQPHMQQAVVQRTGQPLRRAGMYAGLALLACMDVLAQEQQAGAALPPACRTALLWHSVHGQQQETEALLAAQREGDGLLLPFDFLASQPGLLCAHLQPWLPGLVQTLFLPGTAHPHEQLWLQALQVADVWLAQGRFQRVICASLERQPPNMCQYAAISLVADTQPLPATCQAIHGRWLRQEVAQGMGSSMGQGMPQGAGHAPAAGGATGGTMADAALWHMLAGTAGQAATLPGPVACLHLRRAKAAPA